MEQQSRRGFYTTLISLFGSLTAAALALPGAVYLLAGAKSSRRSEFVEAADLEQIPIGKPSEVTFERTRVDGWRTFQEKVIAWVVRKDQYNVVAYTPQCTHLGCAYHWEDQQQKFICPCHSSAFSIDGEVLQGPAARPLDQYTVRVRNAKLLIGTQIRKA